MSRIPSSALNINWNNVDEVIRLAIVLGKGQTVYKHPDRYNYNITHTSRTDRYETAWVVFQTPNRTKE